MAFIQKTVTGIDSAYSELVAFITTNTELISDGEQWVKVGDYTGSIGVGEYFKGIGNGINHVYILVIKRKLPDQKIYNLIMYTFTGYRDALKNDPDNQEGISIAKAIVPVNDSDPIEMVVAANGRRITGFFHTLSNWMNFYLGMFIPYSEPSRYSFPTICIGQTHTIDDFLDYSVVGFIHTTAPNSNHVTSASIYKPDGQQLFCFEASSAWVNESSAVKFIGFSSSLIPSPGGVEPLFPVKMAKFVSTQPYGTGEYYGELDGVKLVSGIGQQTGKIITDPDGSKWIVSQSGKHNSSKYHHAFRMS